MNIKVNVTIFNSCVSSPVCGMNFKLFFCAQLMTMLTANNCKQFLFTNNISCCRLVSSLKLMAKRSLTLTLFTILTLPTTLVGKILPSPHL